MPIAPGTPLDEAFRAFTQLPRRDVESWTSLISFYTEMGHSLSALALFRDMLDTGVEPSRDTFICVVKACARSSSIDSGYIMHDSILRSGLDVDRRVGTSLVYMYVKCESLADAQRSFNGLSDPGVAPWSVLIGGYAQHGHAGIALELYEKSLFAGIVPNRVTFLCVLKACSNLGSISKGTIVHDQICRSNMEEDVKLGSCLVDMYAKCGSLLDARLVFDALQKKTVVSWNAMISGYAQHGDGIRAFELFNKMKQSGIEPIKMTFLALLKACSSLNSTVHGRMVHDKIIKTDLISDVEIGNALVDSYSKWGSLEEARQIFNALAIRTVVSWSALVDGFARHGHQSCALEHFMQMQEEGIVPDEATYSSVLRACRSTDFIEQGKLLHDQIIRRELESCLVLGTNIVDMYAKTGYLSEAQWVFKRLSKRNTVSWGALIAGYANYGNSYLAIESFQEMYCLGLKPDKATCICTLKACAHSGAVDMGMLLHNHLMVENLCSDVLLGTALIDMYAKSGCLVEARRVFDTLVCRDMMSWATLIAGYTHCRELNEAVDCLKEMQLQGMRPMDVIYTSIMSGCSYAGQWEDGHLHFQHLTNNLSIQPSIEQYGCIIDLCQRIGSLDEANDILHAMPMVPDLIARTSFMTGCRTYGQMYLGKNCISEMNQSSLNTEHLSVVNNTLTENVENIIPSLDNYVCNATSRSCKDLSVSENPTENVEASGSLVSSQIADKRTLIPQIDAIIEKLLAPKKTPSLCGHCERVASALGLATTYSQGTHSSMFGVCISCHNTIQALSTTEKRRMTIRSSWHGGIGCL